MAQASGGKCDFVQEGDSISEKMIPQMLASLQASLTSVEIHIQGENNNDFMVSPFPIPNINPTGASIVFLKKKKNESNRSSFDCGVLVNGDYKNETVEFLIDKVELLKKYDEDKFSCSQGRNISDSLLPLFAFNIIKSIEQKRNVSENEKAMAIDISISSGVLCKFTGYIGVIKLEPKFDDSLSKFIHDIHKSSNDDVSRAMMKSFTESGGTILSSSWNTTQTSYSKDKRNDKDSNISTNTNDSFSNFINSIYKSSNDDVSRAMMKSFTESGGAVLSSSWNTTQTSYSKDKFNESKINKKIDDEFDFMKITQLQKADGFWDDLEALNKILGINVSKIDSIESSSIEIEIKWVATILAIAALRKKAANNKNSLLMIERKAINWLKNELNGIDVEQIIDKTQSLI